MPGGDRTGPSGFGPRSGRGAGYCTGNPVPGYANPGWGGFGRGGWPRGGRGFRHRNWYYATGLPGWARGRWGVLTERPRIMKQMPSADMDELTMLKQQADYHEDALKDIKARIGELEAASATETQ